MMSGRDYVKAKFAEKESVINQQAQQIAALNAQISAYISSSAQKDALIASLQVNNNSMRQELDQKNNTISSYSNKDNEIHSLKSIITQKDVEIDSLGKINSDTHLELKKIHFELPIKNKELSKFKTMLDEQKLALDDKDNLIQSLQEMVSSNNLENQINSSESSLVSNVELVELKNKLEDKELLMVKKETEISWLNQKIVFLSEAVQRDTETLSELRQDKQFLREDKDKLNQKVIKLKTAYVEKSAIVKKQHETIKILKNDIDNLTINLNETNQDLSNIGEAVNMQFVTSEIIPNSNNITDIECTVIGGVDTADFSILE